MLVQAKSALERIYTCMGNLEFMAKNSSDNSADVSDKLIGFKNKFVEAMEDDINTADAIAAIFDIVYFANTEINAESGKKACEDTLALIKELGGVLGILGEVKEDDIDSEIEAMIEARNEARKAKDFKTADEIRDKLKSMGIILEDTSQGVKWHRE